MFVRFHATFFGKVLERSNFSGAKKHRVIAQVLRPGFFYDFKELAMKQTKSLTALAAAVTAALGFGAKPANAFEYSGYFRAGPGSTSSDASRACYGLNGGTSGLKYRLGNECDIYGEFVLSKPFSKDGIDYRATLMINHYTGATEPASGKDFDQTFRIEQMFAEAKGFDIAPNATFWMGKERGRRGDVHIVDTFFTEMTGVGAGFKGQPVGPLGKLGLAYYRTDKDSTRPGDRLNVELVEIGVNPGGKLNVFATATKGDFNGGTSGYGLTFRHDQDKIFGVLNNTLWVQYAQGSTSLNSNFGDLTAKSAAKSWRIVESFWWQAGAFGGQAMVLAAREKNSQGRATDSASVGGRASYGLTKNFKLVGEVGYSQYKPDGGQTAKLTKATFAPTLSLTQDFWSRPEFRIYVTTAKWNKAAGNVTGQTAFDNKTAGTSYGAQVEWWF